MSDDELLIFAAKAAGMPPPVDEHDVWSAWVGSPENGHWWNPLENDGDALRLAMQFSLSIEYDCYPPKLTDFHRRAFRVRVGAFGWHKEDFSSEEAKSVAVRLVIVRAAAEIGRRMP